MAYRIRKKTLIKTRSLFVGIRNVNTMFRIKITNFNITLGMFHVVYSCFIFCGLFRETFISSGNNIRRDSDILINFKQFLFIILTNCCVGQSQVKNLQALNYILQNNHVSKIRLAYLLSLATFCIYHMSGLYILWLIINLTLLGANVGNFENKSIS